MHGQGKKRAFNAAWERLPGSDGRPDVRGRRRRGT
jgi:hypothetical protein